MKRLRRIIPTLLVILYGVCINAQTGTIGDPFTSLHQAASTTTAGIYYFNFGGTTFDTHIDANGYVQIALDFGNGSGNLPQGSSLTLASRGILNTTVLASLTETREVRISTNTGNFDVTTTDASIISRIQSNTTLHQGVADNAINNNWTGTNANYITANASCTTSSGTNLNQNIVHGCGNANIMHWIPSASIQRERYNFGEINNSDYFQLWVKGNQNCVTPLTSLNEAASITTPGVYCFNIGGNVFETYVDAIGYVQVAIDFGNGTGNLPQGTSLNTSTRGILNAATLAALTETKEVRISSSTGTFDVTTTDVSIIARVQSNTTLHQGVSDNGINNNWTGTNSIYMTSNASCTTSSGTTLNRNIVHGCGNGNITHWIPSANIQRERHNFGEIGATEYLQLWVKGNTNCTSTITSLHEAASITTAGQYCFDIGGITFDTYVDANGYVQVAFDFGNGVGNLPQSDKLTNASRGILDATVLAALTETEEVRLSSSSGNFDVITTNTSIISRVQSNTTLHQGVADNAINNDWTGTNAGYMTANASCTTGSGTTLNRNIVHGCGNTFITHWIPSSNNQMERHSNGQIGNSEYLQLWVKGNASVLPVKLLNFEATSIDNLVKLDWQTATEINNDFFTIEKSTNAVNWEVVSTIIGAGNSSSTLSYSDIDNNPYSGTSYYRLTQTDFDGEFEQFPIKSVFVATTENESIEIFPNPVNDIATIKGAANDLSNIFVYNMLGQNITALTSRVFNSENSLVIDFSKLNPGIYILSTGSSAKKFYKK